MVVSHKEYVFQTEAPVESKVVAKSEVIENKFDAIGSEPPKVLE